MRSISLSPRVAARVATVRRSAPSRVRATLLGLGALAGVLLSACSKSTTDATQTPANVRASSGTLQTGVVGTVLTTPLAVVVTDASGKTISGVRVDWDAAAGSGTISPSASLTDSRGVAQTTWTLGTVAGINRVTAQVPGVTPVAFSATALAGTAAAVIATPELAFLGVGDTLRLRATVRDQFGNDIAGQAINFASSDAAIASISSVGLITAVGVGATRVIATASGRADTVPVTVSAAGASVCGTVAPRQLAVGEVFTPGASASSAITCLASPAGPNGEYALTLISTESAFGTVTPIDVYAVGNTSPTTASLLAGISGQTAPLPALDAVPTTVAPADSVEMERRAIERRELGSLTTTARDWYAARNASALRSAVVEAKVGDIIRLNANANQACSNPDTRTGRVAAVGERAIVVADTANPSGGYSDAEYANIVATFDTLVYPMDTTAFGAPTNISTYGKIILFYTRNVNALTPPGAAFTIGGFFFARDLYPKTAQGRLEACAGSNVQEMFYLIVPDPNGTVNNNRRTKEQVNILNLGTIAHEFQHLINSSRRLYITPGATANEQTWLDEGLAHIAEELLYYRISGFTSRRNLTLQDIAAAPVRVTTFSNYASQNFSRFYRFLLAPEVNSPYAPNDSLATRGAIWNFLRFAAGRQGEAGEAPFFRALVNSPSTGLTNLTSAIPGAQFAEYLRDWSVSLIADDFSPAATAALNARYVIPAWNFRSIYPGLQFSGGSALGVYPIGARTLQNNAPQRITLAGGASSYVRFGVAAGRSALLTVSSNGGAVPATLRYAVVRLR